MGEDSPPSSSLHFTNSYSLPFVFRHQYGVICASYVVRFVSTDNKSRQGQRKAVKLHKWLAEEGCTKEKPYKVTKDRELWNAMIAKTRKILGKYKFFSLKIVTLYSLKKSDKMTDLCFRPIPFYFRTYSLYFSMQAFSSQKFSLVEYLPEIYLFSYQFKQFCFSYRIKCFSTTYENKCIQLLMEILQIYIYIF